MHKKTVFDTPATVDQVKDMMVALAQGIPSTLSSGDAQRLLENREWLISEVQELCALRKLMLAEWTAFYQEAFQRAVNCAPVRIPRRRSGFTRLLLVAKGLTLHAVLEACQKHFAVDLREPWRAVCAADGRGIRRDRFPTDAYAVWVYDGVEAEPTLADTAVPALREMRIQGITLLECLLFELKYFLETGQHLNRETVTLCLGSRHAEGSIPCVGGHAVSGHPVVWSHSDASRYGHHRSLRVREVIA